MRYSIYSAVLILLLGGMVANKAMAQCGDPDASIWENTWHSCETMMSPNPERGEGHWIQYDFGQVYTLSTTHIWNTNETGRLDEGFQEVAVDYSLDGEEWLALDTIIFEQGTGEATYGGFTGFDFAGDSARYVLLTALSNYGHPNCYGLAEVKFNLTLGLEPNDDCDDPPCDGDECYSPEYATAFVMNAEEVFILWEIIESAEGFGFRYREADGNGEWVEVELEEDEPEVFLEDLEPETTYQYQISTLCPDQEFSFGQTFWFTTTSELEECETPIISNYYFWEEEGYILVSCNEVPDAELYILRYRIEGSNDVWQEAPSVENFWEFGGLEEGEIYEYQIQVQCQNGLTPYSELFMLNSEEPVSTQESIMDAKLELFPNPTRGLVNLTITASHSGLLDIRIHNLMGQLVYERAQQVASGRQGLVLPTQNLRPGVYTVSVQQEQSGQIGVKKLIVAK